MGCLKKKPRYKVTQEIFAKWMEAFAKWNYNIIMMRNEKMSCDDIHVNLLGNHEFLSDMEILPGNEEKYVNEYLELFYLMERFLERRVLR